MRKQWFVNHAYSDWIGRIVGIKIEGIGIVAATVMTPDPGQDHNYINVMTDDGTWQQVRGMDTYRADFINASI